VFPQVRGFLLFLRVDSVHTLASDLMLRVCGVPDRPIRLWGAADYGGPRTALRGLCWVFILVRPSVGFSRSPGHGGWGRVQHDLLPLPPQSCMNRGRSEKSGPAANPGPCKEQKPFFC